MSKQQPRRKREHKTDYRRRLRLLKGRKPRLVVRLFSRSIVGQLTTYIATGDKVEISFNSMELKKLGWTYNCSNIPSAYLTGYALAKKAGKIKEAILDIGFHSPLAGTKQFAFAKGAIDGGLNVPVSEGMFPAEDRIKGEHIENYMETKKDKVQFSKTKKGVLACFEKVKKSIK